MTSRNTKTGRRARNRGLLLYTHSVVLATFAAEAASVGTVPFIFDDNRVFAELRFIRPDGTSREAFAFVDMGTPVPLLSGPVYRELHIDQKAPLLLRLGEIELRSDPAPVQIDSAFMTGPDGERTVTVEAVLPGSLLKDYQVVFDYGQRTLTIARPGTLEHRGFAVPRRVNEKTGLISVEAFIDGRSYHVAIDSGSAYTWFKRKTTQRWLLNHPEWERGTGAVGESNMQTRDDGAEAAATILRLPDITLAALHLKQIGALEIAPQPPPFPAVPGEENAQGGFLTGTRRRLQSRLSSGSAATC